MSKADEKHAELLALGTELARRDETIVAEYKRTHTLPSRGVIDTPERRALRAEGKRRMIEIHEKYKDMEES
jgi:hypothetical protein